MSYESDIDFLQEFAGVKRDGIFGPNTATALVRLLTPTSGSLSDTETNAPAGTQDAASLVLFADGNHNDPWPPPADMIAFIHKASEGTGFDDGKDKQRRAEWKAAGKLWGFYHFTSGADPIAQANWFVRCVRDAGYTPDDLIMLDFENSSGSSDNMTYQEAQTWLITVDSALGCTAGVYGSNLLSGALAIDPMAFAGRPLWIARYRDKPPVLPNGRKWTFWQFTDKGSPYSDMNKFMGTESELRAQWPNKFPA